MGLLAGYSNDIEDVLEPVTGIRDITLQNNSNILMIDKTLHEESKDISSASVEISFNENDNNDVKIESLNVRMDSNELLEIKDYIKLAMDYNKDTSSFNNKGHSSKQEITYNPYNLREKSNLTSDQIYDLLEGSNLQILAETYYEMENKYNVNAIFLMALNMEESGHGTSDLALSNNNIGGVKSIDGGWAYFNDWTHSLEYIASLIDEMYLSEEGPYYNGTSIYDVNVRYCEGTQWAHNLNSIVYELLDQVNSLDI